MIFSGPFRRLSAGLLLAAGTAAIASETLESGFVSQLDELNLKEWHVSRYQNQASWFTTRWSHDAVQNDPEDGALVLTLSPALPSTGKYHKSGEVQRRGRTSYGHYEVVMTAARGEGIISSFFTYTGPHFKTPHDEIDIEFLGRDTTKVWVGGFIGGKKLPGQTIDLGFDAAEGPHLYAFNWQPDSLTWYADGRELLRVTSDKAEIPSIPQKIFINVWGGGKGQRNWSGIAPENIRTTARYYCISYRPPEADTQRCSDLPAW